VGTRVQPSPAWAIDAELSYSPRTLAKDHDDHIKRFKTSEADCTGRTIKSTLGVNWAPRREGDGLRWFVGVGAEIIHTTTDGHQVQSWYGDDPYTEEDDTGTRSPSIKTEIKSTCGSVCMRFGIEL
jgi:hypothetical protein